MVAAFAASCSQAPKGTVDRVLEIPGAATVLEGGAPGRLSAEVDADGARLLVPAGAAKVNAPTVRLPAKLDELQLRHPEGRALGVKVQGVRAVEMTAEGSHAVYRDALPGADLTYVSTDRFVEELWLLKSAQAPSEIRYTLRLDGFSSARVIDDVVEVLDEHGFSRIRAARPYVLGADGEKRAATWSLDRNELVVRWDAKDLKYPAVLDPQWTLAGEMKDARFDFYFARLNDGTYLAAGGYDTNNYTNTAELYSPTTDTWTSMPKMANVRVNWEMQNGGAITVLANGKAVVSGGYGGDPLQNNTWHPLETVEVFDPASRTWSSAPSMARGRYYHVQASLGANKVLVAGGYTCQSFNGNCYIDNTAEVIDFSAPTPAWSYTGSMNRYRYISGVASVANGKVLVVGGWACMDQNGNTGCDYQNNGATGTAELYDPSTGTWTLSSYPRFREYPLVSVLNDGRVMTAGGWGYNGEISTPLLFDPATGVWTDAGVNSGAHGGRGGLATLSYGTLVYAGGWGGPRLVELYDPATNAWKDLDRPVWGGQQFGFLPYPGAKAFWVGGYNQTTNNNYETRTQVVSPIAAVNVISGDNQTGTVGSAISPLVVEARDPFNNLVPGGEVAYTPSGNAKVSSSLVTIGVNGRAQTTPTLGTVAGTYTFIAAAGAGTVTFTATAKPAAAVRFAITGLPTITGAGTALTATVTAYDQFDNVATGYTGTVALSSTDPQGVVGAPAKLTNGVGTFAVQFRTSGSQAVTAKDTASSVSGTSPVTQVTPGTPAAISIASGSGQSAQSGATLPGPLQVFVADAYGNPCSTVNVDFAVASGGGSVSPASAKSNTVGIAQVTATLGTGIGTQTYTATSTGLSGSPLTFTETALSNGPASITYVSGNSQTAVVGNALPQPFVVKVLDKFGAPVQGISVGFAPQTSGASTLPQVVSTDANGLATTFGTVSQTAGANGFQAVLPGVTGSPIAFTATGTPDVAKSLSVSGLASGAAGTQQTLNVVARDRYGNVATGYAGTVAVTSDDPAATIDAAKPLASGAGSFAVKLVSAGSRTVVATDKADATLTASSTVTVSAAAAKNLALLSGNNQNGAVGTTLAQPLRVAVTDAFGNPVAGTAVTFAAQKSGSQVSPASATSAVDGTASTNGILATSPGAHTFTATAAGLTGSPVTFSATATPASAARLLVTGLAATATAGTATTFTVTAQDQYGNTVTNFGDPLQFSSNDPKATVPANGLLTNGTGTFSVTFKTAGSRSITVSDATISSLAGTASATVNAAAASALALVSGNGQSTTVGTATAQPVVVAVTDAYGNAVSGTAVTFAATSSGASVSPTSASSDAAGQAQATPTVGNTVTTYDYTASAAGLTGSPVRVQATARAAAAKTLVYVSGGGQTAQVGQTLSSPLVVSATDAFGNPVSGAQITFAVKSGGGSVSPTSAVTDAAGQARTTATLGNASGAQSFEATASFFTGSVVFNENAGSSAASALVYVSGNSQTGTAGAQLAAPFVVQANDSFGNPVAGITVTFTSTTTGASTNPTSATTDASGRAQTFGRLAPKAGTNSFSASLGSGTPVPFSATGNAGPAATLKMTGLASANAGVKQTLTFTAVDANDNVATSYAGTLHLTSNDAAATLSADKALLNGAGQMDVTLATAGTRTVTATDTASPGLTVTQTATVSPAAASVIAAVSGDAQSGPAGSLLVQPLKVVVKDAFGNVVSGVTVSFAAQASGASVTPTSAVSATDGTAQTTARLGTATGAQTFTASAAGLSGSPVTFNATATAAGAARLAVTALPATATAGSPASFTVTAKDQFDNTVSSYSGTVKFSASDAKAVVPANATLTNGTGTFSVTFKTAGAQQVVAADVNFPGISGGGSTTVGPAAAANLAVASGDAQIAAVNAAAAQPMTAIVTDAFGNPVPGVTVAFAAGAAGGSVSPASATTDTKGLASSTPTVGTTVGVYDFSASSQGLSGSPVTFQIIAKEGAAAKLVYVSGGGQSGAVKSTLFAPLVVSTTDQYGNRVSKATVTFAAPGDASVGSATVVSDGAGLARTAATLGSAAGPQTFTASATFATGSVSFTQTATAAAPSSLSLVSGDGQSAVAGSILPAPLKVVVKDAYGNVASGVSVAFSTTTAGASVNPASVTTDGSGLASAVATLAGTAGPNAFSASVAGLTGSPVGFSATGVPGTGAKLVMTGAPTQITAGDVFNVTVTAWDSTGNVASGYASAVHFASSDAAATLPADTTLTNGTGSFSIKLAKAGAQTLSAVDSGGQAQSSTVAITVNAGKASTLTLVGGDGQSGRPGALLPEPLKVAVADALGNPVQGTAVTFTADGGGQVSPAQALSDAQGSAQALASLGQTAGAFVFTASAPGLTGSPVKFNLTVLPGQAKRLAVSGIPAIVTAGTASTVTVKALDAAGNVDTSYSGTVDFHSTDVAATLPPAAALSSGTGTFQVTLATAGTQSVTVEDAADPTLSGSIANITVKAAAAAKVQFTPKSAAVAAGNSARLDLQVVDAFGNPVAQTAALKVSASGGAKFLTAQLSGATGLGTNALTGSTDAKGAGALEVTDVTAELVTVTAKSTGLADASADVTFGAGAMDHFVLTAENNGEEIDCGCIKVDVQLEDRYGNAVPLALGAVTLEAMGKAEISQTDLGDAAATTLPSKKVTGTLRTDGGTQVTVCDKAAEKTELRATHAALTGRTDKADLTWKLGPVSDSESTFTTDAAKLQARTGKAKITVTPKTACGNTMGTGLKVALSKKGEGALTAVKDVGDGTYTAELSVAQCPADPKIELAAEVEGTLLAMPLTVEVSCAPLSTEKTTVALSTTSVNFCNDLAKNHVIATVTPKDDNGGSMGAKNAVSVTVDGAASDVAVTDVGDGTYTAEFTARECNDTPRQVTVKVNGVDVTKPEAKVVFACAKVDPATSGLTIDKALLGTSPDSANLTVAAMNTCGEPAKGKAVKFTATLGTVSPAEGTTDDAGAFTAVLTAGAGSGDDDISATVDGVELKHVAAHYDAPVSLQTGCSCNESGAALPAAWALASVVAMFRRRRRS